MRIEIRCQTTKQCRAFSLCIPCGHNGPARLTFRSLPFSFGDLFLRITNRFGHCGRELEDLLSGGPKHQLQSEIETNVPLAHSGWCYDYAMATRMDASGIRERTSGPAINGVYRVLRPNKGRFFCSKRWSTCHEASVRLYIVSTIPSGI